MIWIRLSSDDEVIEEVRIDDEMQIIQTKPEDEEDDDQTIKTHKLRPIQKMDETEQKSLYHHILIVSLSIRPTKRWSDT